MPTLNSATAPVNTAGTQMEIEEAKTPDPGPYSFLNASFQSDFITNISRSLIDATTNGFQQLLGAIPGQVNLGREIETEYTYRNPFTLKCSALHSILRINNKRVLQNNAETSEDIVLTKEAEKIYAEEDGAEHKSRGSQYQEIAMTKENNNDDDDENLFA